MLSSTITNNNKMKTTNTQQQQLEKFFLKFPDNATSWANATDEMRDMARTAKEYYNELDCDHPTQPLQPLPALDFTKLSTPAQWNTEAKRYIRTVIGKMTPGTRNEFFNRFAEWINNA